MILFYFIWLFLILIFVLLYVFYCRLKRSKRVPDLTSKAVLITGCDSGFGYELACRLDKLGVTVFAGCLFAEGPGAIQLKSNCTDNVKIVQLDVTKDEDVKNALNFVNTSLVGKKLWAVVNNAGIAKVGPMEWMSLSSVKEVFEVNTFGCQRVTNAFLPLIRKSKGRIIFVASVSGYQTNPGMGAYAMSKHALVSLANAYRMELLQWGVSVHTICPALYRTNITRMDVLTNHIQSEWDNANEEIKEAYGESFLGTLKTNLIPKFMQVSLPVEKIYEVIDDMVNAIIGRYPQIRYFPGINAKFGHWFQTLLPTRMHDCLMQYFLPKPEGVES